jgi:hypothetical protein
MQAREIAAGVYWLGGCMEAKASDGAVHYHVSAYLVVGSEKSVLVDTGDPRHWDSVAEQLDKALDGRTLDYVFPTHPELPHAGNLPQLLARYPAAQVVGDVGDYHVHYPEYAGRLVPMQAGDRLDLGGRELAAIPAYVHDLVNTLWAYDTGAGVLCVSGGFSYIHDLPVSSELDDDEPSHRPGQCRLLSGEMPVAPTVDQAAYGTGRALYWTRFVDVTTTFQQTEQLLADRPTNLIAPAHGNVISDVDTMFTTCLAAHRQVYEAS